jgi:DNA-binding NarL/FixJ family response regulator
MRVVIVEDAVLLREGIARLLMEFGHEVVATRADATRLLETVTETEPDVIIADVRMPPTFTDEGVRAAMELRALRPSFPVLLLSQYVEERYAADLLRSDARGLGYLLKERVADVRTFVDALQRVADGGTALDPEVVAQLFARAPQNPLDGLTPRESEVLSLMAEGRSNAGIAAALVVGEGAIEKHISSIFSKLNLEAAPNDHRRVMAVITYLQTPRE